METRVADPEKKESKPEPPDWLIGNIAEVSKNASNTYLLYLGFVFYCTLTIVDISDRQIILNGLVHLPILDIDVSLNGFFIIGPLIAMFIFIYLQLYLSRLKALTTQLRKNYAHEEGQLYPWAINIVEEPEPSIIGKLQRIIVNFSLWFLLPITLFLFAIWFAKKHDPILSYLVGVYPIIGTVIVLGSWYSYDNIKLKRKFLSSPWRITLISFVFISQVLLLIVIFLGLINVDLSYQKLVTEPKQDYEGLYWVDLKGVHLERANLTCSILKRANLTYAKLIGADLSCANLEGADLSDANLTGASLSDANLNKASLFHTNLEGANLIGATLEGVHLWGTNLKGANLSSSFKGAFIVLVNLEDANLKRADLSRAYITANLEGLDLMDVNLEGASIIHANLREAKNLKIEQLRKVKTLYGTVLDTQLMEQIQKYYPHLLEKQWE